jgi:hypothetical protein
MVETQQATVAPPRPGARTQDDSPIEHTVDLDKRPKRDPAPIPAPAEAPKETAP